MRKINIIVMVLFFTLAIFSVANFCLAEDSVTITTYYPSPYGSYNELTTASNTYLATDEGNVGIGTSEPAAKLHVNGSFYLYGGSGDAQEEGDLDMSDAMLISQYVAGTRTFTASQYAKADINGDGRVNMLDADLINNYSGGTITLDQAHHSVGKYKSDSIINVRYDGNVGIGTANPRAKLDVYGNLVVKDTAGTPSGAQAGGDIYLGSTGQWLSGAIGGWKEIIIPLGATTIEYTWEDDYHYVEFGIFYFDAFKYQPHKVREK